MTVSFLSSVLRWKSHDAKQIIHANKYIPILNFIVNYICKKVVKIGAHEAPHNYFLDSASWASFANLASLLSLRSLFSSFLIASCFIYSSVAA